MNAPWLDGFTINLNQILIVDRWEPPKRYVPELHNCGLCNKNSWFHPLTRLIEAVAAQRENSGGSSPHPRIDVRISAGWSG
jgi:hypothetical protein